MFTGIIEATATVKDARTAGKNMIVRIGVPARWRMRLGQSVAVDGICSTVRALGKDWFDVEYMPETLRKTNAIGFAKGRIVNLERSLKAGDRIDGHFVLGHVDARATVSKIERQGASQSFTVKVPAALLRFVAPVGSITLNGVALTVSAMRGASATVALIPYTLAKTNLRYLRAGDMLNIEVDSIARYLAAARKK